ncbi:MAG: 4-(cytidine 5'-diphospho)-2-C-methyl-D-erythritol kinase, partial [Propionibacteriaceae bacterium]|nr:4-(cytidine 5'-diphospho)-2-C-methyl-D-erythritol kinase [Propionibacteriaceae bacterium]
PAALLNALAAGDARTLGATLVNDLAGATCSLAPPVRRTLAAGLEVGAWGAVVSGSGPTVAFLAPNEKRAKGLVVRLASEGVAPRLQVAHGPVPGARLV